MKQSTIKLKTPATILVYGHPNLAAREIKVFQLTPRYYVDSESKQISAFLQPIPRKIVIYKGEDFVNHAADTQAQHEARLIEILGQNISASLQAIADGTFVVPNPLPSPFYVAAASVFNALPVGTQVLWEPVRKAVADAISKNDIAKAKQILETVPAIYDGAEDHRAAFLELFK